MNIVYQIFPKDLANIVDEYAKDRTNYDKIIHDLHLRMMGMFTFRYNCVRDNTGLIIDCKWARIDPSDTIKHFTDAKRITNSYRRGSTMKYIYPTQIQKKFNKVLNELKNTWRISDRVQSYRYPFVETTYKSVIYYHQHKKTDAIIQSFMSYYNLR